MPLTQTQPFYTVKNARNFPCILLARLSVWCEAVHIADRLIWCEAVHIADRLIWCEAVHIADRLICAGYITSFVSVTLMALWLGFGHYRVVCVEMGKLSVEYFLFNFIPNLDYD